MRSPGFSIEKGKDAKLRFLPDQGPTPHFYIELSHGLVIGAQGAGMHGDPPVQRYRVPVLKDGKVQLLDMTETQWNRLMDMVAEWIAERMRLARLRPLNPSSKRYRQRQARKTMRRHS